jgi:Flp pilus assembly pilin Flp
MEGFEPDRRSHVRIEGVSLRGVAIGKEAANPIREERGELTRTLARDERGQGTTEYAILVGVLVVIAIVAIVAFRGKVTELWQAISDGVNSL